MMDTSFYPRKRKSRLRDKKKLKIILNRLKKIEDGDFDRIFTTIMVEVHLDNLNHIGKERREYKKYKNKLKIR